MLWLAAGPALKVSVCRLRWTESNVPVRVSVALLLPVTWVLLRLLPAESVPPTAASATVTGVSAGVPDANGVLRTMFGTSTATPPAASRLAGTAALGAWPPGGATKVTTVWLFDETTVRPAGVRLVPVRLKVSRLPPCSWMVSVEPT